MSETNGTTRRGFIRDSAISGLIAVAATRLAEAQAGPQARRTRSYNPEMEYRPLGKTGVWLSAVCMGGHWKRIDKMIGSRPIDPYSLPSAGEVDLEAFHRNRADILSRCIDRGINLVDACTSGEIVAYARALKGRREAMFMTCSWAEREMRNEECRTAKALLKTLEDGLKEAGLECADIWRVTCHEKGSRHTQQEIEELMSALDTARRQGKARVTGLSSHDRPWLKMILETYPTQVQMVCSPYTADSVALPEDSLFASVIKHRVGFLGIKPFASASLFKGDSAPASPDAAEDDRRARLAIRYILGNPAITAPIPGLTNAHQVDNVAAAVGERRKLAPREKAELHRAAREMWANLPPDYEWLRDWQYV